MAEYHAAARAVGGCPIYVRYRFPKITCSNKSGCVMFVVLANH